ncbi:Disease resistance family protein / LRR family protein [Hibiscus syriacus]|uniref:Disease resistance family protein / LRR family protein n=1 Tax=Hibiscus syriacus TaxID=106335 RepID=A0A6A2WYC3_HIBSY|nr:Disease resistance family protein / LRR family protein [Hibiscus syriacus]
MAGSSPAVTKSIGETTASATKSTATATAAAVVAETPLPPPPFQRMDTPPKTQRGLNKPKCIQCGNVARSSKIQVASIVPVLCRFCFNTRVRIAHARVVARKHKIHAIYMDDIDFVVTYKNKEVGVLGLVAAGYEVFGVHTSSKLKIQSSKVIKSNSAFPEKTPTSSAPSSDQKSTQASSQVSHKEIPDQKGADSIALNEWRFSKLKQFKERNIEIENDAFDRYMQNISFLEEVFSTECERSDGDEGSKPCSTSQEDEASVVTSDDQNKLNNRLNKEKPFWVERSLMLSDIFDKLNKARNEEDIKYCLEIHSFIIKAQLYNQSTMSTSTEINDPEALNEQGGKNDATPQQVANYPFRKLLTPLDIDQETLNKVDEHFSSLEQIEDL